MRRSEHDARQPVAERDATSANGRVRQTQRRKPKRTARRSRAFDRLLSVLTVLAPTVFFVALAAGIAYVRLLQGPISLKFLVAPIERGLSAEFAGANVQIDKALLRLTDAGRLEFRLSNVRLADGDGQPVASAPLAAIELSSAGLWKAQFAPTRIELIDPRLLLVYSQDAGLSLSFARSGEPEAAQPESPKSNGAPLNDTGLPAVLQRIDLARALAESSARARRGHDATSHLREIGLRNATIVIEQPGGAATWRVPEVAIDLEHKQKRSIISGKATIISGRTPWSLTFRTEESEKSQTIEVIAAIRDLVPRTLVRALPQLGLLDGFDLPVSGNATFQLSRAGEFLSGAMTFDLSRGRIQLPWLADMTFPVDAGLVDLRYHRDRKRIEVAPSTVRWGQSRITVVGDLSSQRAAGGEGWAFDLRATEGAIAAEEFGVRPIKLDSWLFSGHAIPERRHLDLNRFHLKAGGAEIELAGVVDAPGDVADASFEGRIGPMPAATLKALWPRAIAPGARTWTGERIIRGQVQGGTFRWLSGRHLGAQEASPQLPEQRLSLALEATDLVIRPISTMSPIEAPRALVRLEGGAVEVNIPDSAIVLGAGRRIPLKSGRFTAVDVFSDVPIGEVAFRVNSPLPLMLELIDQEPLGFVKLAGMTAEGVDGKVDGQLKFTLPLVKGVDGGDIKVDGKMRITEGRARQLVGPYDVQAASINIDFAERSADVNGEMLVAGVPATVSWQRPFDTIPGKPSQIRLMARLDNADRTQLGFDVNHILQGEIPVELRVTPTAQEEPQVTVHASLTNADIVLETIAWRKPPGSPADVQFEVVRGKDRTELNEFRVRGENIAADGQIIIGADNRLREFSFSSFTLNLVSQLEMQGVVRPDNVLDVKVKGRHFDGRDFFRTLFSVGQFTEKPLQQLKPRAGLDVSAEIETLAGYSDVSLRGLKLKLSNRADRLVALEGRGTLDGGKPLVVSLVQVPNEPRRLRVDTPDAGQAMRLIGFYPNMQGGRGRLDVNLDGKGAAEKTGTLLVEDFRVLGDPVVSELLSGAEFGQTTDTRSPAKRQMVREVFEFDRMLVPFSVGYGQFVLEDGYMRGPLVGVNLRGKVDFKAGRMSLGGTYIPLQGLNNMLGGIPVIGQILSGPRGEGIFGITFGVQGSLQQPQVTVNPLSLVTPGIFRGLTEMTGPDPRVTPLEEPKTKGAPKTR